MVKKRQGEPWMSASDYGQTLKGMSINLLVMDIERSLVFHREVLGADVVYADVDFAVVRAQESEWMLHADHTYSDHPLFETLRAVTSRGVGAELRVHGCDPDTAEAAAHQRGDLVLVSAMNKPHGLREVYIVDPDGYLWVPDIAVE